jgi:hypothetical protein
MVSPGERRPAVLKKINIFLTTAQNLKYPKNNPLTEYQILRKSDQH